MAMLETAATFVHHGPLDASTRAIPVLAFLEKYTQVVDSLQLDSAFHEWYAPSCNFFDTNGTVFRGGKAIWTYMQTDLFGAFIRLHHEIEVLRAVKATPTESDPARDAYWVLADMVTDFWLKEPLNGDPITARRFLIFLIGNSEIEGQGTNGLQILELRAWWDTAGLKRELAARKEKLSTTR